MDMSKPTAAELDLACELLDEVRHLIGDALPTRLRDALEPVAFGSDTNRLIREWAQRRSTAADPTPTSVLIHQHGLERS